MFDKLKELLVTPFSENSLHSIQQEDDAEVIAVAALMVEIITVDDDEHETEKAMLRSLLKQQYGLSEAEAESLINEAVKAHQDSTDFYRFTEIINQQFDELKKINLIESLWQLAWADKQIHELEEHVIRRLASLLYVSHKDFIAAKLRVVES